jgi:tetratricopeptide (TPR) repeat protein
MASKDQYGLKVKLPNGNVAGRVLPVQIHDLKEEDKCQIAQVLGGFLRAVEMVYSEPGVNRPLTLQDSDARNMNKTNYRNQINKVANAIDEIITGLRNVHPLTEEFEEGNRKVRIANQRNTSGPIKRKLLPWVIFLGIFLVLFGILMFSKIFKQDNIEKLRSYGKKITVAVLPFQNMTNDSAWNIWQDGIQEIVTSSLSNTEELRVIQTEYLKGLIQNKGLKNYDLITTSMASSISQKINADVFIQGKILKSGDAVRLYAKLIDSNTREVIKSMQIEGEAGKILRIGDSLSSIVKNYFLISNLEKQNVEFKELTTTKSPDAYKYYILGKNAYYNSDMTGAIDWLSRACAIDSNFTWAMWFLSVTYQDAGLFNEARKWDLKLYPKKDMLPLKEKLWACYKHAEFCQLGEAIRYLNQLQEIDTQSPLVHIGLGWTYFRLQQYEKAIAEYEKALEIYERWDSKPIWSQYYYELGLAYHYTHNYHKVHKLYRQVELESPDNPVTIKLETILMFSVGDTLAAERHIEKFKSVCRNSYSEVRIARNLAEIYSEADIPDKAEKYYRKALSIEPDNPKNMNNLAYILIDKNLNVDKGLELIDHALEISPTNTDYLATKGWGLYKQGKFKDALGLLEKSWNNKLYYYHTDYLHLLEARKAIANQ